MIDIKTSVLYESAKPAMVMLDYMIDASSLLKYKGTSNGDDVR